MSEELSDDGLVTRYAETVDELRVGLRKLYDRADGPIVMPDTPLRTRIVGLIEARGLALPLPELPQVHEVTIVPRRSRGRKRRPPA